MTTLLPASPDPTPGFRLRLARRLLTLSRRSTALHLAASLFAGLLAWVHLMPLPPGPPPRVRDMVLAIVVLVGGLYATGCALNTLQPVFVLIGRLPGWVLVAALALLVLAWRTWLGHRLLGKIAPFMPGDTGEPAGAGV